MSNTKVLILSNNNSAQAIINFNEKSEGEIKFFNFNNLTNKNYALGVKQGENIVKIPLKIQNNYCKFNSLKEIDFKKDVVCAVVDVSNVFCPEIVLSGSLNSAMENEKIENCFVAKRPEDTSSLYEIDEVEEIDKVVEKNLKDDLNSTYFDACANCKYRKAFYEDTECCCNFQSEDKKEVNSLNFSQESEKIEKENNKQENEKTGEYYSIQENEKIGEDYNNHENNNKENGEGKNNQEELREDEDNFYLSIKNQIENLFNKYEEEKILRNIISNSKWVKINYDNGEGFYVLGLIFDDENTDKVKFISYGIPSNDCENPPEDLKEFAQWLEISVENFEYKGYWLIYQSAENGGTIKVDFV